MTPSEAHRILEVIAASLGDIEPDSEGRLLLDGPQANAFRKACTTKGIQISKLEASRKDGTISNEIDALQNLFEGGVVKTDNEVVPLRTREDGEGMVIHLNPLKRLDARYRPSSREVGS